MNKKSKKSIQGLTAVSEKIEVATKTAAALIEIAAKQSWGLAKIPELSERRRASGILFGQRSEDRFDR